MIDEISDGGVRLEDGRTLSFVEIAQIIRGLALDGNPHRPQAGLRVGFDGEQKGKMFDVSVMIEMLDRNCHSVKKLVR